MDLYLDDQTCIVTGGASGIGLATALLLLEEGAQVGIWDAARLTPEAEQRLADFPDRWMYCQTDVTRAESLQGARESTQHRLGRVRHVIHAAAIGSGKFGFPFTNLSPDDWERVLEVNVMGMVRLAHCLAPEMRDAGEGSFTFLASVAGQIGSQTDPPYSASKAANINFAQCMAKDLAPFGVRVNVVNPGMVRTPLNESVWRAWAETQAAEQRTDYSGWAEAKIRSLIPLRRWQSVEDVAAAIAFLTSRRAANITGQCLNVDGGFVMHS